MHMIMVIGGGLLLLAVTLLLGRLLGGAAWMLPALKLFIPLWLVASAVNMWIGVTQAGYTVAEEFPILLVIFGVPALIALGLIRFLRP